MRKLTLAFLFTILAACQSTSGTNVAHSQQTCTPENGFASGAGLCLAVHVMGLENAGPNPTMVVFLHGDISRGGAATYHIQPAEEIADEPGVIGIAMIRPGYFGQGGKKSEGSHTGRRNHYTEKNNQAVGEAIAALKAHFKPARTIIVGHSGGAAQTGVVIGRFPGIADHAVLVSCPCDIPKWRAQRGGRPWDRSQSPIDFVDQVPQSTQVTAVTGSRDSNTKPNLARAYVDALTKRGGLATYVEASGASHSFNRLWPSVKAEINKALEGG